MSCTDMILIQKQKNGYLLETKDCDIPKQMSFKTSGLYCPGDVLISDLSIVLQMTSGKIKLVKRKILKSNMPTTMKTPIDIFIP